MKFSIQHRRSVMGNDIDVAVDSEGDNLISHVTTTLDGFDIGDDELDSPCASYQRQFLQAGDTSPHLAHKLAVQVRDMQGKTIAAEALWEDLT